MALKYVIKKTVFGFDKTQTEKYVARLLLAGTVSHSELCKQVAKRTPWVSCSMVKTVIEDLIDELEWNLTNHMSVKLDGFGTLRPGFSCKCQSEEKDVNADVLCRRRIIFSIDPHFRQVLSNVCIKKSEKR